MASFNQSSPSQNSSLGNLTYQKLPFIRRLQIKLNQITSYIPPPPSKHRHRRILLVHSHPVQDSFANAISNRIEQSSSQGGHECQRINLHDGYQSNLSESERKIYFSPQSDGTLERDVRENLKLLHWCDTLIFVYPTWWMNTPASLKGFFDRTLLPYKTWDFPATSKNMLDSPGLVPLLSNIRDIIGVSTYGASQSVVTLAGDNGRRMISNGIRPIMNKDCTLAWLGLYNMDIQTLEGRIEFLLQVDRLIKTL